ncbi:hypothetical protein H4R18_001008 [Coemansia javaensis]|uniref:Zinc/iron permease n=1 Tax=Coemansia javaensis TaxID=2761396 RepID=A0A9W8HGD4_9FUNG|nr:hypothetical protein H4R18_001008 [Coemansia javaensis]
MQPVFRLVLEGLAMFAGSWAAGCVPLYVRMDQAKFSLLALFGAGLLVGAALGVIMPEGVETLTRALQARGGDWVDSANTIISWALVGGFCTMFLVDNALPSGHHHHHHAHGRDETPDNDSAACLDEIPMSPRTTAAVGGAPMTGSEFTLGNHHQPQGAARHPHRRASFDSAISPSADHLHSQWPSDQRPPHQGACRRVLGKLGSALSPRHMPTTLLGILVHSCADGLALGAAVAGSAAQSGDQTSSLEIIVFLALLLHKAPAAFGLVTTLKQQGHPGYRLGVWLTIFAASAPLAALLTFAGFSAAAASPAPAAAHGEAHVQPWAGIVMIYSAGTFLYVAMAHTLAEAVAHAKSLRARAAAGLAAAKPAVARLGIIDMAVLLLGVVLPPLVSKDHDD